MLLRFLIQRKFIQNNSTVAQNGTFYMKGNSNGHKAYKQIIENVKNGYIMIDLVFVEKKDVY